MGWGPRERGLQTEGTKWGGDSLREWPRIGRHQYAEEAGPAVGGQRVQMLAGVHHSIMKILPAKDGSWTARQGCEHQSGTAHGRILETAFSTAAQLRFGR